jgi:hypothetical protein
MTMARNERTVEDLIAELDGQSPSSGAVPQGKPPGGKSRRPASASPGFGSRWLLAVALLALGFGAGWTGAGLRPPAHGAVAAKPGQETRQDLLAAGWQESDQGVFTRRCQGNCRRPVLYGGGVVDVMEVHCLERPCGEIRVEFGVVDGRGQVIEQLMEGRPGRQGERLQIVLESQRPEARSFVLQSFSAKARLD